MAAMAAAAATSCSSATAAPATSPRWGAASTSAPDGARTGVDQALQSFTIAPVLHLSRLVPGLRPLGVTYPRTSHPLHWVDLKLEYRANHSDQPVFSDAAPDVPILSADHWSHQLQLQFVVNY